MNGRVNEHAKVVESELLCECESDDEWVDEWTKGWSLYIVVMNTTYESKACVIRCGNISTTLMMHHCIPMNQ